MFLENFLNVLLREIVSFTILKFEYFFLKLYFMCDSFVQIYSNKTNSIIYNVITGLHY